MKKVVLSYCKDLVVVVGGEGGGSDCCSNCNVESCVEDNRLRADSVAATVSLQQSNDAPPSSIQRTRRFTCVPW